MWVKRRFRRMRRARRDWRRIQTDEAIDYLPGLSVAEKKDRLSRISYKDYLLGPAKARELYYFSERIPAGEAERLGIVNAVLPEDKFEQHVMERARRLAAGPRTAHRYMKENLNRAVYGRLAECLDLEATNHVRTTQTEDHEEAARAFVEKREPNFRGR